MSLSNVFILSLGHTLPDSTCQTVRTWKLFHLYGVTFGNIKNQYEGHLVKINGQSLKELYIFVSDCSYNR